MQEGLRYEQQGIVLVHGFGAGVFAWRHIMQPLAQKCGCRVIAFDRPGFGAPTIVLCVQSTGSSAWLRLWLSMRAGFMSRPVADVGIMPRVIESL